MKKIAVFLFALGLPLIVHAQALPDNPDPAALDTAWRSLGSLVPGQPILVENINSAPVHCLFARATDVFLLCYSTGIQNVARLQFNRADVLGVELDGPVPNSSVHSYRPPHNYHPAWLSSMIAGGLIVGIIAARTTDAGSATQAGFIGAGVVGLIGAPFAFLPQNYQGSGVPAYPQYGIGLPLFLPHGHLRFHLR